MVFGLFKNTGRVELFEVMEDIFKRKLIISSFVPTPQHPFSNKEFNRCLKENELLLNSLEKDGGELVCAITARLRGVLIDQSEAVKKEDYGALKNLLVKEEELIISKTSQLNMPFEQYARLAIMLNDYKALTYFKKDEVINFFKFCEVLLRLVRENNIKIVYSIDKSGRILGFLFHSVMSNLGLAKNMKFYFIEGRKSGGGVTIYSEKQKEELKDKNVLVIDELVLSGQTIRAICSYLRRYVGDGEVFPVSFGAKGMETSTYNSVTNYCPSWYNKKEYSGVTEKEGGGVEVAKGGNEIAKKVRTVLYSISAVIADYLKIKGY